MQHPHGLDPPREWFQAGRVDYREFRAWMTSTTPARDHKFHACPGPRADLGHTLKSALEADCERFLRFLGYRPWMSPGEPPGRLWYRYEGEEYTLTTKQGKTIGYKPDFHLWDDGHHSLWEAKGLMDARSKRAILLMTAQHPELPLTVITRAELEERKRTALWEARRRGEKAIDIPEWEWNG